MKTIITVAVLFLALLTTAQTNTLIIQGDVVNIRKSADVKAEVVTKAKQFDKLEVIKKDKLATVGGKKDYWYKVIANGIEGYVFGHFTSLKLEGQKTDTLIFRNVDIGDCFHVFFSDLDFGAGENNYGDFNLILDVDTPNLEYINKKFKVVYNNLAAKTQEMCNPDYPVVVTQELTIVSLSLVK